MPYTKNYKALPNRYGPRERDEGVGGPSGSELGPVLNGARCEFCKAALGVSYWVNKLGYPVCEAVACRRKSGILEGNRD